MAFHLFKNPRRTRKKLLNFAHHYEFEESGLKIDDLKKLISEKKLCMIIMLIKEDINGQVSRFKES